MLKMAQTVTSKRCYITIGRNQKGPTVVYVNGNVRDGFTLQKSETDKLGMNISDKSFEKLIGY